MLTKSQLHYQPIYQYSLDNSVKYEYNSSEKNINIYMELHCIKCKKALASYNGESGLYKLDKNSFEKSFSNKFDYLLEYPISLHCKFHPANLLKYNKDNTSGLERIKCQYCKKKSLGVANNKNLGIEINFETVQKNIEFGNTKIRCPGCKTLYDLDILRTKGTDIDIHIAETYSST